MNITADIIIEMLLNGQSVIVQFTDEVEEFESCIEENMKGKIISFHDTHDTYKQANGKIQKVYKLRVDLSQFEDYNDKFLQSNYFDKKGEPCLNCKQAGYYPKDGIEEIYISIIDNAQITSFKLIKEYTSTHYQEYVLDNPDKLSYIEWLEKQLTTAYNHLVPSN